MTHTIVESPDGAAPAHEDLKAWSTPLLTVLRTEEAEGAGGIGTDFGAEIS